MAEQIYEAYPLKVGKPAAMRAISKALVKVDGDWLLNVTKAFAVARAGDMAFCPHPATWFNAERYNDSPGTWVRDAAAPVQRSLGYIPDATGV